jgi:hypothetical protein
LQKMQEAIVRIGAVLAARLGCGER